MADNLLLPLIMPAVPEGFCETLGPDWIQSLFNLIAQGNAILSSAAGAGTIILNQEGTPGVDQRNFLWRKPTKGNLIFQWITAAWVCPHPYAPNDPVASMWVEATPAEIWAFDGGDGSDPDVVIPTAGVGAMWKVDHAYDGRSPMGVGAIPGSDPAISIAKGQNLGEGSHVQTIAEMPAHTHGPKESDADGILGHAIAGAPATYNVLGGGDTISSPTTGTTGGGTAFGIVHSVRGMYRIIRTGRQYYTP